MKILIIRFSSIGDIVLATPVFRCVKEQLENVELHFLCKKAFKDVTIANPYIDHFHYFDGDINKVAEELNQHTFDYVIDLHKNFRTYKLRRKVKSKWYSFKKLSVQKFILTKFYIDVMPKRHISLRSLDAVKPLGVRDDGKGLDYFIPKEEEIDYSDLPASHYFGFIALIIGASYATKKLPVYKLKELCSQINFPIVLVGGKEDAEEGRLVAELDPVKIYNACGKFSLNGSADIVRKAKLIISHDTGLQYIASAFNKRVLAIWGGTSPKLDVEPYYGTNNLSLHINFVLNLYCQPCSNFGTKKCPEGHFKCMKNQDIKDIASKTEAALKAK
jgi:heptosyltransferase-2